jgi:putative transposase
MSYIAYVKVRYRFRFYPTAPQKQELARAFGSCRYVYNWALRIRTDAYYNDGVSVGYHETSAMLTKLKRTPECAWLSNLSCVPPQQALRHLQTAFVNFFEKRAGYPNFKRKDGEQSAEYTVSALKWDAANRNLSLSKIGRLDIRWSRSFKSTPTTVTVIKDTADRYFITLCLNEEPRKLKPVHKAVGIDLGINSLATLSTGEKIENPRHLKAMERKLARAQRDLARKTKGSKRRAAQKLRVARLHAGIADARSDYLHKVTTDLVRRFDVLAVEDLNVRGMTKNHGLARSLSDAALGEFLSMLRYKCEWYGRELRTVDRFYPSSKRCFACGYVLDKLALNCRTWTCPECGEKHDRDINAAKNILAAGQAVTARGGKVRLNRGRPRKSTFRRSANQPEHESRAPVLGIPSL